MTASRDLMRGWSALGETVTNRYEEAMSYYRGTVAERFASEKIRTLVESSGQAHKFRLAAVPVKVMSKRCRIASVTSDRETVTGRLEEIREANGAVTYEPFVIRRTFIYGDAYVMVWPGAEEVEIRYQSPLHCRAVYAGEDGKDLLFVIRRWLDPSPLGEALDRWRAEVWYPDRMESWVTKEGAKGNNREDWLSYAEDEEGGEVPVTDENWPEPNPWDEIPIKHARTDLPYGVPVHEPAFGPQDMITKAITTQFADIEAHGWPERYRILDDAKILESGREPVRWDDAAEAPAATPGGVVASGRRSGPGIEHTYPGTKSVGQYTPPDPGVLINPIDQWVRLMSVVSDTPLSELDPTVQLSGISREKADAPTKAKERELKAYLKGFWVEVYSLAVRMAGVEDPGTLDVTWVPPDVTMDGDWWTTAGERVRLGVPINQILAEANYAPEQIKAWLDSQGEEMALMQRIEMVKSLGEAVQTLGVGIQLGVLSQEQASRIVERVVGEATS